MYNCYTLHMSEFMFYSELSSSIKKYIGKREFDFFGIELFKM